MRRWLLFVMWSVTAANLVSLGFSLYGLSQLDAARRLTQELNARLLAANDLACHPGMTLRSGEHCHIVITMPSEGQGL